MKTDNQWLRLSIFFSGICCGIIFYNLKLIKFTYEVEFYNFFIGILTILTGLYIAESIQKKLNLNQKTFEFIIPKIEKSWVLSSNLKNIIFETDKLNLLELSPKVKEFDIKMYEIRNYLNAFNIDLVVINEIESKMNDLNDFLDDLEIANNSIDISNSKNQLASYFKEIDELYIRFFQKFIA